MSESLKSEFTIALDAMGGDLGPEIVILAAKESLEKHENLRIVFFGKEKELVALCKKNISDQKRIKIVDAQDVVEMSDSPVDSIRNKKNSSMRIALDYVKEKKADACVSAGNTGALMATAKFVLKTTSAFSLHIFYSLVLSCPVLFCHLFPSTATTFPSTPIRKRDLL